MILNMPLTRDEFLQQINASGLMGGEVVASFLASFPEDKQPADGEALARELVKQKKLTKFQAEQIYAGKGKSLVLGNYVILDKLGQGGMGMVLKAEHKRLKRLVAIKMMSPAAVKTPDALKRFHREVEAAAKLRHPNVVATDDADEAKGIHFLVMEYVEGSDLSVLVKKQGPLSVEKAVACIVQAAKGLEFAHEQGVIHRDIKPANLLIDTKGTVKILDMGLARIEGETGGQAELTSTGAVMGTVDYMAPEQALSTKHADARSDIYSLGISLWYLLTGKCAYDGDSLMAKLLAHRDAPIPSLSSVRNEVSGTVEAVFRKMVSKQAKDRYQTMTEVIKDLEGCLSGQLSSIKVNLPQATDDSQFNAFLNNFDSSSGASAAVTKSRLSKAPSTVADSASEATLLTGDMTQPTDPQTLTSFGSQADHNGGANQNPGQRKATSNSWWQDRRVQIGGGAVVLLMGLIWFLIPPRPDKSARQATVSNNSATEPSSEPEGKSTGAATAPTTGQPKDSAEKKALDWLFSVGAIVSVGQPGAVEPVRSTEEALASDKSVVAIVLNGRPISDQDLAHLSAFPTIWSLSLRGCEFGDKGMVFIGGLPQLNSLDVYRTKVTDRGLLPLLKYRSLHVLNLEGTLVTSEGLATIGQISSLRVLDLNGLPVTDQSLTQLQKLPLLRNLFLSSCLQLTDDCGAVLAQFPTLEYLRLDNTSVSDRSVLDLSKSPSLRDLHLNSCKLLTDECGDALSQFPKLDALSLNQTTISDRAVVGLSKSKRLMFLNICFTNVTNAAISSLSQMKSLSLLHIQATKFTADGVKQLVKAMPWCEIQSDHGVFKPTEKAMTSTVADVIDPPQYALDFNYKLETGNARVELPPILRPFEACTVEMYVTTRSVLDKWDNRVLFISGGGMQLLQQKNNWSWSWSVPSKDGTYNRVIVEGSVLARRRMHLAGVSTGKELRLFIDGHLAGKTPLVGDLPVVAGPCLLGGLAANFEAFTPFDGLIDEVRILKVARYNENFTLAPRFEADADTLALYHFDEGQGDILKDSSGNNHHGQIVGAKWVKLDGSSITPDANVVYLDDLPETLWEGFSELGKHGYWLGKPSIFRDERIVLHALFTSPDAPDDRAVVEYDLSRRYELFQATVYLLREPTGGPQTFRVLVDGKLLWESTPLSKPNVETPVSVSVRNAQRLRLEVTGVRHFSWPVWLAPRLTPVEASKLNAGTPAPPPAKAPFDAQQAHAHQEAWAKLLGTTVETTNSVGAKMILIPPGEFLMGSTDAQVDAAAKFAAAAGAEPHSINRIRKAERPQHRAVVAHPFRMGRTEVTVAEFRAFVTDAGYMTDAERFGAGNSATQAAASDTTDAKKQPTWKAPGYAVNETFPVTQVSWNDAQAYCQWLSEKDKADYRLPTETEWEYACRAGTTTQYSFGDDASEFDQQGWHLGNANFNCHPVAGMKPNALGLFDMHGNLEEWCGTQFDEATYSKKSVDALPAAASNSLYAVRGGHWFYSAAFGRSAFRGSGLPTLRFNTLGFRVAQKIIPQPPVAKAPFDAKAR